MSPTRFPISFDAAYAALSRLLLLPPSDAYVELAGNEVKVRMAWGFRASFDRATVRSTSVLTTRPISRGVHGFNGRWLVNGSGDGILVLTLAPVQRGYVMGFPVRLKELQVSVEDPQGLARALGG